MALRVIHGSFSSTVLRFSLLLAFFFFCCSSWRMVDGYGMPGGRKEVKDVKNNKEVQDLGSFSVNRYNKNQHHYQQGQGWSTGKGKGADGPLEFKEVVKAQTQVVSGLKYYLTISASQGGVPKTFDAVVVVKPWIQSKQLLAFAPSTN
ncbi:cysteine proteinase inhibitor B-like [Telopea speciosissima]|uniref:cysteine proteinase inhibitor B-like n=1 Tax=Telopea speciosissima TaxID=54955 RepID=UPI001CC376F4|nr:cysteine proteinase inhibitor B-like [Telopea speciosissima]